MALASEKAQFSALKVGYDGNADDDIDDGGDDLVVDSPFGSTSITPTHDDNGNLTFDGSFRYTYDAWPLTTRLMHHGAGPAGQPGTRRSER